jgi:hypothetical protein
MYGSLFWIEWLDRLDRVLTSARQDVLALRRPINPRGIAAIERSMRQLKALTNDLRLLDRSVLATGANSGSHNLTEDLQRALDTALLRLGSLAQVRASIGAPISERVLMAIDASLRDGLHEAALLLEPRLRRA